jgi:tight adherence protein B
MNGMGIFFGLVFLAVFLLAQGMVVPVFGENAKMRKRLRARLGTVAATNVRAELASLMRQKYLTELSPLERWLETLPGMEEFSRLIEQSGRSTPAYRVVLLSLLLSVAGFVCGWTFTRLWYVSLLAGAVAPLLPALKILRDRARRRARFDEQLPEALDVIKRALKAGHPFSQCLKLVADDMDAPINGEFDRVFTEINYGGDLRSALLGMLERMPSVSVMAVTTAVLVQKETGGNLAETLERITAVIRGRFKLHRRIRTLSAEGRLSAWILAMVPLVLFAVMSFTTPDYLPALVKDPRGPKLIFGAVVMGTVGILWIRRIIRIEV